METSSIWDRSFEGIAVRYTPKAIHVKTEPVLLAYLRRPEHGAPLLAAAILASYKTKYGVPLAISLDSLAVEILGHVYIDVILEAIERLRLGDRFRHAVSRLKASTEVIDCGEKDVDGNRFLWDGLAPFADVIYAILGDRA